MSEELCKREWHYLMPPRAYSMAPCSCGNEDTKWSEFQKHLWCSRCQKDFKPEHAGIFDGPVMINICAMMGIYFDRFNLVTQKYELFDIDKGQWYEFEPDYEI